MNISSNIETISASYAKLPYGETIPPEAAPQREIDIGAIAGRYDSIEISQEGIAALEAAGSNVTDSNLSSLETSLDSALSGNGTAGFTLDASFAMQLITAEFIQSSNLDVLNANKEMFDDLIEMAKT
ncbi:MAG: hypothetical protein LBL93_02640 [Ruminococcus sp.]|jgi:hypothetical protein|nr:hypothetical protein [Ruminococcus sp.]